MVRTSITAAALAAALAPATASADSSLMSAPGARNLAGGGGHLVWAAPTPDGRFKLTVRTPGGSVAQPDIPAFDDAPQPAIGTSTTGVAKRLIAVYTRDGDVFELDLATGTERRLAQLSTGARETAAAVTMGRYVVVRATGSRKGLWTVSRTGRATRLTRTVPSSIALAQSRVASVEHGKVVIRRLSGRGPVMVAGRNLRGVSSLWLTRYRVGWATHDADRGTRLFASRRFAGSGGPYTLTVITDPWTSASPLHGIATDGSQPTTYLDDQGVKRFDPRPFHGR